MYRTCSIPVWLLQILPNSHHITSLYMFVCNT
jgi:hypothetical protein